MEWKYKIKDAPRGHAKTKQVKTKDGMKEVEYFVKDKVLISSGGLINDSYWMPEQGRWNKCIKGEVPDAWAIIPEIDKTLVQKK